MNREQRPDELDLTESEELASAVSAAVGRLRQLAAAAFDAGREEIVQGAVAKRTRGAVRASPSARACHNADRVDFACAEE